MHVMHINSWEVSPLHSTNVLLGRGWTSVLKEEYIIGLVDGEGSFNVRVNESGRRRAKVEMRFSVKLRHHDKEILYALKKYFGCGNVYVQRDKRANHTECYRFEVANSKDLSEKIIPWFEKNPPMLPSRKRDFGLFRQIMSVKKTHDTEKIKALKEKMHWGLAVYGKSVRAVGTPVALIKSEQGNARQTNRAGSR
jgi:hypothetical protein